MDPWVEWESARVVLSCPHCQATVSLGPPSHHINISHGSGITVSPWFYCLDCQGIASVSRGSVVKRGFRLGSNPQSIVAPSLPPPDRPPAAVIPATSTDTPTNQPPERHLPHDVAVQVKSLMGHRIVELREMAKDRDIIQRGSKHDLATRIAIHDASPQPPQPPQPQPPQDFLPSDSEEE